MDIKKYHSIFFKKLCFFKKINLNLNNYYVGFDFSLIFFYSMLKETKMKEENEQQIWINPKELFEQFGIALPTQAKYRMQKKIPYSKIGSKIFYKLSDINRWIDMAKVN